MSGWERVNRRQRLRELPEVARVVPVRAGAWLRARRRLGAYEVVDAEALSTSRRSDTAFIFGSGGSLNELSTEEWEHVAEHDVIGFNWFVHERFVRCDYHLIRGIPDDDLDPRVWKPQLAEYFDLIRSNPCFAETTFLVQSGFRAINGNRALGYGYLPGGSRVFLWRTNTRDDLPSRSFADGLVHGHSTLQECVNFAALLGWRKIVLAGVDLYDRRYFWLPADETRSLDDQRGAGVDAVHSRTGSGMIATLERWRRVLADEGIELEVYNPRSLLAGPLPVYQRQRPAP
jgi:hypothetical protein